MMWPCFHTACLGEGRVKWMGSRVSELSLEDPSFDEWTTGTRCPLSTTKNSQNQLSGPGLGFLLRYLTVLPSRTRSLSLTVPHLSLKPALRHRGKTAATWLRSGQWCMLWMEGILQERRELRGGFRCLAMGLRKMKQSQSGNHTDQGLVLPWCCISHVHSRKMLWAPADEEVWL